MLFTEMEKYTFQVPVTDNYMTKRAGWGPLEIVRAVDMTLVEALTHPHEFVRVQAKAYKESENQ